MAVHLTVQLSNVTFGSNAGIEKKGSRRVNAK
jgi:hypothetical protein